MTRSPATRIPEPPRMTMVWQVLEAAKDADDEKVIAACRRLITANQRGWKKHARAEDIALVRDIADA